jgi:hypothetical protein
MPTNEMCPKYVNIAHCKANEAGEECAQGYLFPSGKGMCSNENYSCVTMSIYWNIATNSFHLDKKVATAQSL